jgi:flagellar basal-body rod protein FlgC
MNSIAAIAASGMSAASQRLRSAAHNVANVQTEGFRREMVVSSTLPGGGVTTRTVSSESVGPSIEADMVAQLQARNAFGANLSVFRTAVLGRGRMVDVYG